MTRNLHAALAIAAGALFVVPAFAQTKEKIVYDPVYDDEIVITAPIPESYVSGESGARIETVSRSLVVSAADLDLRYEPDANELRRRIRDTALEACREVRRASRGVALTSQGECLRDAEREATAEAEALIAYRRG